ncbi:MAG: acetoacetate--CoA ligase [Phycisphaerales bacterium]|nr:acetoacetate--CoA ligase [Phycisphaerales bacterium]
MSSTPLWVPPHDRANNSQMAELMRACAARFGFPAEWESFRKWAIAQSDRFWTEMMLLAKVKPSEPAEAARAGEGMLNTRWFPGLKLNYARHLLTRDGDSPAIIFEHESGLRRELSWIDLRRAVAQCQAGLRAAGVTAGDRVAGFMPNVPETIIAMLATTASGAIWSSCSPDFGRQGVLDRFGQIEPKVLFTAESYAYNGRTIDCVSRVAEMATALPSVERIVVVPLLNADADITSIANAVRWGDFLTPADDAPTYVEVSFNHPLFIMYSSGTTGIPKCIVHGHGGTLIQILKEMMLHCDVRPGERVFYFTTCGWMMLNWLVTALGVGATVVLYEGAPAFPDVTHLWRLAERERVNVFGASPKYLAACEKAEFAPGRECDLSPLRAVLSTVSPLAPEQFDWVYDNVKSDLQLSSISGGTDIISCFMLGNPLLPVYRGQIQCRGLGMDVQAWDENGKPVTGSKGELVCAAPFPSQPVGFWNDPDGARYRAAYFEHYADREVWRHGDFIEITETGGIIVYGRSDATLNPGGVRIGTAEIYRIVEAIPEVLDSIVVGKPSADNDVEVCLFLKLAPNVQFNTDFARRVRDAITAGATRRHVPRHIRAVPDIPYTISGKKVELAVLNVLMGEPVANRDALANPASLDGFVGVLERNGNGNGNGAHGGA